MEIRKKIRGIRDWIQVDTVDENGNRIDIEKSKRESEESPRQKALREAAEIGVISVRNVVGQVAIGALGTTLSSGDEQPCLHPRNPVVNEGHVVMTKFIPPPGACAIRPSNPKK